MADGAAHLVDRVLPRIRLRQWVVTFPGWLAVRLAFDASLCAAVIRVFARVLSAWQRARRARADIAPSRRHSGAVVVVQRSTDSLGCWLHLHVLAPDGVYLESEHTLALDFDPQPAPAQGELESLTQRFAARVDVLLRRRGIDRDEPDEAPEETQLLLRCASSPARRRSTGGGPCPRPRAIRLCASHLGYQLHAATSVNADDLAGRERLCRYLLRPALATSRLTRLPGGDILVRLKKKRRNGVIEWTYSPQAFIARLAALVPPPGFHTIRYFGVLSSGSPLRPYVVPSPPEPSPTRPVAPPRPRRMSWPDLHQRVWLRDIMACPCGGRLRIVAVLTQPDVMDAVLAAMILSTQAARPPTSPRAR